MENAISYEQRYFESRPFDPSLPLTTLWINSTRKEITEKTSEFTSYISTLPEKLQSSFILTFSAGVLQIIRDASRITSVPADNRDNSAPETFQMDINRIIGFHNDWQDITIMSSLAILFRQCCAPHVPSQSVLKDLKTSLWVLLNDAGTSLSHVALYITQTASKLRGREFSGSELDRVKNAVETTLCDTDCGPIFKLVRKRIGLALLHALMSSGKPDQIQLDKLSLGDFYDEIAHLGSRIHQFCQFIAAVYSAVHAKIWNK